jgi:PAS domain-containing protein
VQRADDRRTLTAGMGTAPQKALALIVARELASNLATPMFLLDANGDLVFYNEAAELLLARPFQEHGQISAATWADLIQMADENGEPMRRRDSPPGIALIQRRPAHARLQATAADGTKRIVEVTAYPLFAKADELHGAVAIFWETDQG